MAQHIYLFSPSGAVDAATLERSVANLTTLGYKVTVDRTATARHLRFAGTDAQRAAAFERAAASRADICMVTRGGYGLTRYLPQLDLAALATSGKKWVGFSDFTAFQMALLPYKKSKVFAGPSALTFAGVEGRDFSASDLDEVMLGSFTETMDGVTEAVGWDAREKPANDQGSGRGVGSPACAVRGRLWGGNLTIVCSLLGTPFFPKFSPKTGGLFFCEDVGEYPYRTERCFTQLLSAGVLQQQKAVILGQFTGYKLSDNDNGFDIPTVVHWLRAQLKPHGVPVITGLPFGHVKTKVTLPYGGMTDLIVERNTAFLVFEHAHGSAGN
jgi:muramoyltetrapeptide carboxypeptidase